LVLENPVELKKKQGQEKKWKGALSSVAKEQGGKEMHKK